MSSHGPSKRATSAIETSRSLLALVRENDSRAWDRLVTLYSPLIFYWCQRMRLPEQEMPDIFQEVFHSVARNIATFRRDRPGDTFRGWLRTVTQNKVRDHYRRVGREPQAVGGTEAQARISQLPFSEINEYEFWKENDEVEQTVFCELLEEALSRLYPHFQEQTWKAFWRVVVDGRPTVDVASELSMQPGAVRVAKSRVLHRLRQEIGDALD